MPKMSGAGILGALAGDSIVLQQSEQQVRDRIVWGIVSNVDSESGFMSVDVKIGGNTKTISEIIINNSFTNNCGFKIMPLPKQTYVILYERIGFPPLHIGYYAPPKDLVDNKPGTKDSLTLLQRYIKPGESQILGAAGNEILLSVDGSVLIRNKDGAYVRLDSFTSTMEGFFANLEYQLEDVRIRAGNTRRPTDKDTKDNEYILNVDGEIKGDSQLTEEETGENIPEFTVQVGTNIDPETGVDAGDPYVGTISMAETVTNEDGTAMYAASKQLKYVVKTADGGGIAIDEDGSVLIMDQNGGTVTKFKSGTDGEKSFRVENTYISIEKTNGIKINQESGAYIELNPDGSIEIQAKGGRGFVLNDTGLHFSVPDGSVDIQAKDITFIGNLNLGGGVLRDFLLPATMTATMHDTHFHEGPAGPPIVKWSPLVLSGALQASQINIAG